MKRIFIILVAVSCQLLAVSYSHAQVPNAPNVFDPDCYAPHIGTPGEVDTIVGNYSNAPIGVGLKNIGPKKGESYGRMMMSGLQSNADSLNTFATGHDFNLHKLSDIEGPPVPGLYGGQWRYGHFHSMKYKDILYLNTDAGRAPIIYWADDNGNYDTSQYTKLYDSRDQTGYQVAYARGLTIPYSTYITSDTVEDILCGSDGGPQDSLNILFYKGGEKLFSQGKKAIEDSAIFLTRYTNIRTFLYPAEGDFRGTGRADLIISDSHDNFLYYRNDSPFSLERFKYEIQYDTLLSHFENPQIDTNHSAVLYTFSGDFFPIFPKQPGDKSVDLMFNFNPINLNDILATAMLFYKGGPDFGSKRIYLNQPDFHILSPDKNGFPDQEIGISGSGHAGDLSGKGFPLMVITENGLGYGYEFYYATGKALDDKADMFLPNDGLSDTLVGDADQIPDLLDGLTYINSPADPGMLGLIHGSNKIPTKLNSQWGTVKQVLTATNFIISPNPMGRKGRVDFTWNKDEEIEVRLYDLLGRTVFSERMHVQIGEQVISFILPSLASGAYVLELSGSGGVLNKTILIMQ